MRLSGSVTWHGRTVAEVISWEATRVRVGADGYERWAWRATIGDGASYQRHIWTGTVFHDRTAGLVSLVGAIMRDAHLTRLLGPDKNEAERLDRDQ